MLLLLLLLLLLLPLLLLLLLLLLRFPSCPRPSPEPVGLCVVPEWHEHAPGRAQLAQPAGHQGCGPDGSARASPGTPRSRLGGQHGPSRAQ